MATALALTATACGGGTTTSDEGGNGNPKTLTYWASNQGTSLQNDKEVLTPVTWNFGSGSAMSVLLLLFLLVVTAGYLLATSRGREHDA